jgi:hypothetical protein
MFLTRPRFSRDLPNRNILTVLLRRGQEEPLPIPGADEDVH